MRVQTQTHQKTEPSSLKKPDKRIAIIDAARELFTVEGYETTTMAAVAHKACVAVGTVYLYFKNKSELLYGVRKDFATTFVQAMRQPELATLPHHLRTRALIEACFKAGAEECELIQLMGLQPQVIGPLPENKEDTIRQAVQAFFDEAVEAGSFRPVDTYTASVIAFGMVNKAMEQCFQVDDGSNQQKYIDMLVDAFERWLLPPEIYRLLHENSPEARSADQTLTKNLSQ